MITLPMPQQPERRTNLSVISDSWELGRTLYALDAAHIAAVIPVAEKCKLDSYCIELLKLLLAAVQMYDELGLRKEQQAREDFFKAEAPVAEEEKK